MLKPIKHTRYEYIDEFGFYYVISDIINFPDKRYMVEKDIYKMKIININIISYKEL